MTNRLISSKIAITPDELKEIVVEKINNIKEHIEDRVTPIDKDDVEIRVAADGKPHITVLGKTGSNRKRIKEIINELEETYICK